MWELSKSIEYLNQNAEDKSVGRCAEYVRKAVEAGGVKLVHHQSAKDYGSSLLMVGFVVCYKKGDISIYHHKTGDIGIVQPISGHPHGHIAMYNGSWWISDFVQHHGLYPGLSYRNKKPPYSIYKYKITK